jgi:hypothetical protein
MKLDILWVTLVIETHINLSDSVNAPLKLQHDNNIVRVVQNRNNNIIFFEALVIQNWIK